MARARCAGRSSATTPLPAAIRIEIDPEGAGPHVIKPASLLPAIKGPVRIEGMPWRRAGELVALDGSGFIEDKGQRTCAGATDGQFGANVRTTTNPGLAVVDTQGVEIRGLEIRNFCIGVLIHRASGNAVEDNRIVGEPRRRRRHADRRRRQRRLDRDDHDPQQGASATSSSTTATASS